MQSKEWFAVNILIHRAFAGSNWRKTNHAPAYRYRFWQGKKILRTWFPNYKLSCCRKGNVAASNCLDRSKGVLKVTGSFQARWGRRFTQVRARTRGDCGIGEWGDIIIKSSILLCEKLSLSLLFWLCQHLFFFVDAATLSSPLLMNARILFSAISTVGSSMLAIHTRNHPGSEQWNDEPGEMFSLTSLIMTRQRAISASEVFSVRRWLKSIQRNRPAFLCKQLIPTWAKLSVKVWCLFSNLLALSERNFSTNSSSDSREEIRCWVWDETSPKLDIFLAHCTTWSL